MKPSPLLFIEEAIKHNKKALLSIRWNRTISCRILAVDKHFNLLVSSATETRIQPPSASKGEKRKEKKEFTRELGSLFIRGDTVMDLIIV
ncbi:small nuclear ribonucleoprotein D2 [Nematocida sp. LUAm3]|nr:small nuclear ribonucleoprotein D2 [Nematocida sp. LUAm3]KAI5175618.1 small nuclear ribonucleoprotein D2 [Nematocida sp. LUAm2]KAI5171655.1 small nuclear ribonucleoprotein D2 [Nematocida sp. LUAm3]KAI5172613.1 small nuclear ribonucleoprotein D2 [Nematocida sp. LUAm3]KAI5173023.1 small nuclear ribonucleoprotein D2 [Nematocida sp. LUAm3]